MFANLAGVLICTSFVQHSSFITPADNGRSAHTKLLSHERSVSVWWEQVDQVDGWVYVAAQ
jgi:hypothetical protein